MGWRLGRKSNEDHAKNPANYSHDPDSRGEDTVENIAESVNVVAEPAFASTVAALSKQLHAGWRAARKEQN